MAPGLLGLGRVINIKKITKGVWQQGHIIYLTFKTQFNTHKILRIVAEPDKTIAEIHQLQGLQKNYINCGHVSNFKHCLCYGTTH